MNEILRRRLRSEGIPLWKVALTVGVSEQTLIRWMRTPLEGDRKKRVDAAVEMLMNGGE